MAAKAQRYAQMAAEQGIFRDWLKSQIQEELRDMLINAYQEYGLVAGKGAGASVFDSGLDLWLTGRFKRC